MTMAVPLGAKMLAVALLKAKGVAGAVLNTNGVSVNVFVPLDGGCCGVMLLLVGA